MATETPVMTKSAAEELTQAAGLSPLKIAEIAGGLQACKEAQMTWKEASEVLDLPESVLVAVHKLGLE